MKYYNSIEELVGKTPLLKLNRYIEKNEIQAEIFAKLEYFNPAGSVKDRVAKRMIETAEKAGKLKKGSVIIEPTSGNTGIGLAAIGIAKGYEVILTMPETMSIERRNLLKAYGAKLVLTEGKKGMTGAIEKATEIANETENSFIPSQFDNPENPMAHYESTGIEIWEDLNGEIDVLVAGIGTGGTISGTGKFLKEKNPNIKIVGIEPSSSPILTKGIAGPHKIQGIGAGFVPKNLNKEICDEIFCVENEQAIETKNELAKTEGILVGISAGAALFASKELAKREEFLGKKIVVILPDTGERYLS